MFKVFIAADIEGICGYVDWAENQPEDSLHRAEMTAEVNAAIEGALAGGQQILLFPICTCLSKIFIMAGCPAGLP